MPRKIFFRLFMAISTIFGLSLLLYHYRTNTDIMLGIENLAAKYDRIITGDTALNRTKVATIIEPRDDPLLLPTILNFLAIVPGDWPFLIWCSDINVDVLRNARSLRPYLESGKVELRLLPPQANHDGLETVSLSRLLTRSWYWHQFHPEAEWCFIFQIDSILCSNSNTCVDDWLGYDFVGGPTDWAPGGRGGNGGLSIRKLSTMKKITKDFEKRLDDLEKDAAFLWPQDWFNRPKDRNSFYYTSEDVFFVDTLKTMQDKRPSSVRFPIDDGREQGDFSLDIWNPALPEARRRPLGIHTGAHIQSFVVRYKDGSFSPKSQALVDWCPEVLILRFGMSETDKGAQAAKERIAHPE